MKICKVEKNPTKKIKIPQKETNTLSKSDSKGHKNPMN
jgi:hypothetical protein